jgi:hypothetical protein
MFGRLSSFGWLAFLFIFKHYPNFYKQKQIFNNMEKEIGIIPKSEYQGTKTEIALNIKEYNGKIGIDIREFTQSETYTGPTKKGLRIPAAKFEEFKTLINSIKPEDLQETSQQKPEQTQHEPKQTDSDESGISEDGLM